MRIKKSDLARIIKEEVKDVLGQSRWADRNKKAYRLAQTRGDKTVQQQVGVGRDGEPVFTTVRVLPLKSRTDTQPAGPGQRRGIDTPPPRKKKKRRPRKRGFDLKGLERLAEKCKGLTCTRCWRTNYPLVLRYLVCALNRRIPYEEMRSYIENPTDVDLLDISPALKQRLRGRLEAMNTKIFFNELDNRCQRDLKAWTIHRWHGHIIPRNCPQKRKAIDL